MEKSLLVAGFGGQGVMVIGKLIGECAFEQGMHVTFMPSYGPEQRGGTANCTVIQSDRPISAPSVKTFDVLCALNQPSFEKFVPHVARGGVLMTNSTLVDLSGLKRDDLTVVEIDADKLAREIGSSKTANVILFAAYMTLAGTMPLETAKAISMKKLAKKPQFAEMNQKAFDVGVEVARRALEAKA